MPAATGLGGDADVVMFPDRETAKFVTSNARARDDAEALLRTSCVSSDAVWVETRTHLRAASVIVHEVAPSGRLLSRSGTTFALPGP